MRCTERGSEGWGDDPIRRVGRQEGGAGGMRIVGERANL